MANIQWFGPRSGKGSVEDVVSHLGPVRQAVTGKAMGMAREASMALSRHHLTGAAHINVTLAPPRELDVYVEMHDQDPGGRGRRPGKDRSAASIEFGWEGHDGLHILGNVMNRAIGRARGK